MRAGSEVVQGSRFKGSRLIGQELLMRALIVGLCGMLGSFAAFAAEGKANGAEPVFDLRGGPYARERRRLTRCDRVRAAVTLKNSLKLPDSDVTLTLNLATGAGEKVASPL